MPDKPTDYTPGLTSIIVPVFNQARFIGQSLERVFAQNLPQMEVIVIDDGSEDDLDAALEPFREKIILHRQPNRGISAARNKGLELSHGEFIAYNDADDFWAENRLRRQHEAFRAHPEVQIVFCASEQFYDDELSETERAAIHRPEGPIQAELSSVMLARREVFETIGDYDERLRLGMCLDWSLRCRNAGIKTLMLPEVLHYRRIHRNNSGRMYRESQVDRVKVLKAHLDRMRAARPHGTNP